MTAVHVPQQAALQRLQRARLATLAMRKASCMPRGLERCSIPRLDTCGRAGVHIKLARIACRLP